MGGWFLTMAKLHFCKKYKQNKNRKDLCPATCSAVLFTLIDNKQPTPGMWRVEQAHASNHRVVAAATHRMAFLKCCFPSSPDNSISERPV